MFIVQFLKAGSLKKRIKPLTLKVWVLEMFENNVKKAGRKNVINIFFFLTNIKM